MTAQVLAFPGCHIDTAEGAAGDREFLRSVAAAFPPIEVDHPSWCDRSLCLVSPDGSALHRTDIERVGPLIVAIEQVVEVDGTAAPVQVVIDGGRAELEFVDARKVIAAMWQAHDVGGGAS